LIEYDFGNRQALVEFLPNQGRTTVRVTFDAETENDIDIQRNGCQAILNNFSRHVEQTSGE